ncbi:MAG: polysaccharide deacetylase family protein [Petrotogales bacterium]
MNINKDTQEFYDLTSQRKAYVNRYLESLGFRSDNLNLNDYRFIFNRLARIEEYISSKKYRGQNREIISAPYEQKEEYLKPVIELKINSWIKEGKLTPISNVYNLWPEKKKFCLCITHDVDQIQEYRWRERLRQLRFINNMPMRSKLGVFGSFLKQIGRQVVQSKPLNCSSIEHWLEAENNHGFTSSFLFMADPIPMPTYFDMRYRYDEKIYFEGKRTTVAELIKILWKRGWDIGLHGSKNSHKSSNLLKKEKKSLEKILKAEIVSIRQHYLFFDIRQTPRAQNHAGFKIDSTLGSSLKPGFRCGTGSPYPFYDLKNDEQLSLLEIPLVMQDIALFRDAKGNEELMTKRCIEMIDRVASLNGAITVLWHNAWSPESVGFRCYKRILKAAAERGAWGCSMRDLASWWQLRTKYNQKMIMKKES